jgi:predicted GNAT family N-acyltransferase
VLEQERGNGLGKAMMQAMLQHARSEFPTLLPKLSAQTHAIGFYSKLGWRQLEGVFDDAGIPHVAMVLPPESPTARARLAAWNNAELPQDVRAILES